MTIKKGPCSAATLQRPTGNYAISIAIILYTQSMTVKGAKGYGSNSC